MRMWAMSILALRMLWENRHEKKNGNAENLVDSLLDYSLTEGGPRFQYGDIHTHIDTERQSKNEIDHILILKSGERHQKLSRLDDKLT